MEEGKGLGRSKWRWDHEMLKNERRAKVVPGNGARMTFEV